MRNFRNTGQFCWIDIKTPDMEVTKHFYNTLLGWAFFEEALSHRVATKIRLGNSELGGLTNLHSPIFPPGTPPHVSLYAAVEHVDQTAEKVAVLGGRLLLEPFDVPTQGRMATLQDPFGAVISLWESDQFRGMTVDNNQEGAPGWFFLMTPDIAAAGTFYQNLLGWTIAEEDRDKPAPTLFRQDERIVAGMINLPQMTVALDPQWVVAFQVNDCESMLTRAVALGAKQVTDILQLAPAGQMVGFIGPDGVICFVIDHLKQH